MVIIKIVSVLEYLIDKSGCCVQCRRTSDGVTLREDSSPIFLSCISHHRLSQYPLVCRSQGSNGVWKVKQQFFVIAIFHSNAKKIVVFIDTVSYFDIDGNLYFAYF